MHPNVVTGFDVGSVAVADDPVNERLVRASRLLGECGLCFWAGQAEKAIADFLGDAEKCCAEAESQAGAEAAATIGVLRSTSASIALRSRVTFVVGCDFDDDDGTLLGGLEEYDEEGVTRTLTDQAIRAARAALDVDPRDALVPLQLGHALTWSGDQDGMVAAYEEALRRDPRDPCARSCLKYVGPARRGSPRRAGRVSAATDSLSCTTTSR